MKTRVIVYRERSHPGDIETLGVLELPRAPMKGEYIVIKGRRYKVETVDFLDNGEMEVKVDVG